MKLEPKDYLVLVRLEHVVQMAHHDYVVAMRRLAGLDGTRPHTFDDETLEITPQETPIPPLVQPE